MKISIIIVNWNAKKYILKCLQSIYEIAKDLETETIVVDNNSTDDSVELIKQTFPDVKLICNHQNLGFARANNIGINRSRGKYLFLINSDVILLDQCLQAMIQFMDENLNIGMLGPRILNPDRSLQLSCYSDPDFWNLLSRAFALDTLFPKSKIFGKRLMNYWNHNETKKVDILNGCFWMVRKEALKEVGLLDEKFFMYGEDMDWCKRFRDANWDVVFYPKAQAIHFGGASSANAPVRFYLEMFKADFQYWQKHQVSTGKYGFLLTALIYNIFRFLSNIMLYILSSKNKKKDYRFRIKKYAAGIKWVFNNNKSLDARLS